MCGRLYGSYFFAYISYGVGVWYVACGVCQGADVRVIHGGPRSASPRARRPRRGWARAAPGTALAAAPRAGTATGGGAGLVGGTGTGTGVAVLVSIKLLLTIYIYLHLHRTAQPLYCTAYGTLHGRTSARRAGVHTSDRAWRIGPAYGTGATDCKQLTSPLAFD